MSASYARAEDAPALQLGDQAAGDLREVVADDGGPQPEAGQPGCLPTPAADRRVGRGAGEDRSVARVPARRRGRRGARVGPRAAAASSSRKTTRSPKTCSGSSARPAAACSARISATMSRAWSVSCGVTKPTSAERATSRYGTVRWARALTIGWPCGGRGRDRRALDAEVPALEVDVVQLVAVDEAAGGDVPDLRVVLPAVPEPAHHLDVVGGLVEEVGRPAPARPERRGPRHAAAGTSRRPKCAASFRRAVTCTRTPGAAAADVVEGGDRLGEVERLGVGDHRGRHEPDVPGQRGDPGGDEHRVQPAAHLVGAPVGPGEVRGLRARDRPRWSRSRAGRARPPRPGRPSSRR